MNQKEKAMRPIIGITQGDPAGIGAEVIVKALADQQLYDICAPLVIGDAACLADAIRLTGADMRLQVTEQPDDAVKADAHTLCLIDLGLMRLGSWQYGQMSPACGEAAYQYIAKAIDLARAGQIQATVTAPINKEALHLAGCPHAGHTEIFADLTHTEHVAMLLVSSSLRVIHVSTHVSLREACDRVSRESVRRAIGQAQDACVALGIANPRIAAAGLNPHSSENGLFGREEKESILPAIEQARIEGINVTGPVPPDTVFIRALSGEFDIVVAMYHDQGHIPLKLTGFVSNKASGRLTEVSGVNITIGLPIIRTSVDHGTAFDLAGQGKASARSMTDAIRMAALMAQNKGGRDLCDC